MKLELTSKILSNICYVDYFSSCALGFYVDDLWLTREEQVSDVMQARMERLWYSSCGVH